MSTETSHGPFHYSNHVLCLPHHSLLHHRNPPRNPHCRRLPSNHTAFTSLTTPNNLAYRTLPCHDPTNELPSPALTNIVATATSRATPRTPTGLRIAPQKSHCPVLTALQQNASKVTDGRDDQTPQRNNANASSVNSPGPPLSVETCLLRPPLVLPNQPLIPPKINPDNPVNPPDGPCPEPSIPETRINTPQSTLNHHFLNPQFWTLNP